VTYNETHFKILNNIKLLLKLNVTTSNITSVKRKPEGNRPLGKP
jgi:hypothetical protein